MAEAPIQQCSVAVLWIDWYPYHVARFRGMLAAPRLHGRGVGIEFVGGTGVHAGLRFREELPADLPVSTLMPLASWGTASKPGLARMVCRRLSELDPEVVLVPGYYTLPAVAAALWARVHGATPVLMTESTAHDHPRTGWRERVKGLGLRLLFDWALAGGRAHVDYLRALGFPAERIRGFYDVVDNRHFSEGTRALRTAGSARPSFLYVGRLAAEKNVATLLESWLAYRAAGGDWPLVLVGGGPEATALKAAAEASSFAADVHFPGLKSSDELLPFYAAAGCFVLPSTREPWGLVVNEALAAGLPVLVSARCGCAPELVREGTNGFTFDPADATGLTALLHSMAGQPAGARAAMGQASARIVEDFSPEHFGESVASILAARRDGEHGSPASASTEAAALAGGAR